MDKAFCVVYTVEKGLRMPKGIFTKNYGENYRERLQGKGCIAKIVYFESKKEAQEFYDKID